MENFQSVTLKQRLQRGQAEIENMLMVDRVEFRFLDEIQRVRKFQNDASAGFEQRFQARDKIVRVRRVRENIVAQDQIGLPSRGREFARGFGPKKFFESLDPFFP